MATDDTPFTDLDSSRDYSRVALVLVSLLAILVAASALPVLAPDGTQSPVSSLVPIPEGASGGSGSSAAGQGSGSLGALSPGQQTGVGGSLGGQQALSSQSAETHFVVQSSQPGYWRTGAYATYTGSGWERAGESEPYDGSIETRGMDGSTVNYRVKLERTARALPTAWRPKTVSRDGVLVTDARAVRAERALPAGTTYSGESARPPSDEELLWTAGTDYPSDIERRYTQLSAGTERRLGPETDDITAGASNPYEKAERIEAWLESNKEYSLNVSQPPGDDVASEFVTEMDAGYCEYFATSMAAMLRTQDIPARYVVGYSTGQQTGENTYTVRGMNAHAWVEVYFPEVGWVKFDPTPAAERRQQERESLANQTSESVETVTPATTETGTETGPTTATPTDTPTPTGTTGGDGTETDATSGDGTGEGSSDGSDDQTRTAGDYTVALNRSATPGAAVEVTVTNDRGPVSDVGVLFNDERIGTTNRNGNVTGRVPYSEQLNITVVDPERSPAISPGIPTGMDGRFHAVEGPMADSSTTFPLATNATVTVSGDAVTGNTVTVTATVGDVPVRDAAVSLSGRQVAETGRDGQADVRLPDEPGNVTLTVQRESVSGNVTLQLRRLTVTTDPTAPLALPFTGVQINATLGDEPAPGANVTVGGQQVTTTGVDGTATAAFPFAASATVGVEAHGQQRTTTYDGLFRNLGLVALAVAAIVGGVVVTAKRYDVTPRRGLHWTRLVGQLVVGAVVAVGSGLDRALDRLRVRVRLTVEHLRALIDGRRSLADLLDVLRMWAEERAEEVRTPIEEISAASVVPATSEQSTDSHATIRESWGRFLDAVSIRRPHTSTPGEIADHAVSVDDLPEDDVTAVRDAFRDVEYGQRDPTDRAPDVESAVTAIETSVETGDDAATDADNQSPTQTDAGGEA